MEVPGAQTLLRALDILQCLAGDSPSLSLNEISEQVGLTTPTTYRLLRALMSRGIVVSEAGRQYALGPTVMRMASVVMHRADDLVTMAIPHLQRLRDVTGETVSLHNQLGSERICTAELVSTESIRMESGVGQIYPLHAGAASKVLLAWQSDQVNLLPAALEKVTQNTIVDRATLLRELEQIRSRGYAVSLGETVSDAAALAVPIFGPGRSLLAAMNVAGPAVRWNRSKMARLRPEILAEASRLMDDLAATFPSVGS